MGVDDKMENECRFPEAASVGQVSDSIIRQASMFVLCRFQLSHRNLFRIVTFVSLSIVRINLSVFKSRL